MKKIVIIVVSCVLVALFISCYWFNFVFTKITIRKLSFPEGRECLYIKNKARGLNYSITVITNSSNKCFKPNEDTDYIFSAEPTLFYKINEDSLLIYCYIKSKIPSNFNSKINIIQKELSNLEYIYLKNNYKALGINYFTPSYNDNWD
ncbi:MAG: hypothetical protein JXR46_11445 [Calditrichaceae bacterium]|nr:hypothetical protein [Calditrichaceae bacterium]MBN2709649.1 hypothetical protein [Calditrichaceae bacterium]RQV92444.1 MAG: hypothetical protein EH224_15710 [Calditrichota bacterium]